MELIFESDGVHWDDPNQKKRVKCGECGEAVDVGVHLGAETSFDGPSIDLCELCAEKTLAVFRAKELLQMFAA